MKLIEAGANIREYGFAVICLSTELFVGDEENGTLVFMFEADAVKFKNKKEEEFPEAKFTVVPIKVSTGPIFT